MSQRPAHGPGMHGFWRRLLRRAKRTVPAVVWLLAVGSLFWLSQREERGVRLSGFARATTLGVAPEVGGRLSMLAVQQDEDVVAGQLLASLDSAAVDLSLAAARAELAGLEAELKRENLVFEQEKTAQESDYRNRLRRFVADREEAHIDVLKMDAQIQRDEVRLQAVELELNRLRAMESGVVAEARLEDTEIEFQELATRINASREVLAGLRELHGHATARVEEFVAGHTEGEAPDALLKPIEWAISAQRVRLEEIHLRRTQLAVRAPIDGRVSQVLRRPGEVVAAGEAILSVVEREPREIVVHVPEAKVSALVPGVEATVRRHSVPGATLDAVVLRTGSLVERIPQRVDPQAAVSRWGIPVYLRCPQGQDVLPGERFTVFFRQPREAVTEAADELAAPR